MSIAQELYEGIELGEYGLTGLITYMRTDSLRLADEATAAAAGFIRGRYGDEFYPGKPRVFRTKGNAQDAHEAIRPSDVKLLPDEIRQHLTPDQYKLYKLIWSRFVACQMADAILDTVSADIVCEGQVFRASGHTVASRALPRSTRRARTTRRRARRASRCRALMGSDTLSVEKLDPERSTSPSRGAPYRGVAHPRDGGARHRRPSTHAPTIRPSSTALCDQEETRRLRPHAARRGVTGQLLVGQVGRGLRVHRQHGGAARTRSRRAS